ncbi:VWA domain-containing protein [Meiothermus sp. PNK-Is4]|nr:VWA domain-containing protein [Meiothermus sp. Pnk-1]RYM35313.1 VWA domain-containing protein [Meiothermus sp. PNK-Is4]
MLLLLCAAWGPSLPLRPARTVVMLDQSPSAREATARLAPQLELPGAQYLAFASRPQPIATPTARRTDLGDGTDLEQALEAAQAFRPDRIVLVSDGLWQTQVPPPPVPVYALAVSPSPNLSLSLLPPAYPMKGEVAEVRVLLESTTSARARLIVEGPAGRLIRELRVEPGQQSLGYRFPLESPAVVRATLQSPLGTKQARLEVAPIDQVRVWVLGDPALARYLEAQGFAVEEPQHITLPIKAQVVALGKGALEFSPAELDALQSFLAQGGSLLWTATPKGLFFGSWERSTLADAIPLEPLKEDGGVGLVLVLDVSGSMLEADKLGLALSGALELIRSAREQDYIGVVAFSSGAHWIFRPRPMTPQGRREAESLLLSARAGGGTVMGEAYAQALQALQGLKVQDKQVLVLTDGLVQDPTPPILQAAHQAQTSKIRTNTVALGTDADRGFLRELARQGGGSFYDVPRPQDLPRFFLEEAQRAFRREALVGNFPLSLRLHPITRGLNPPPLSVILPAKTKPWAQGLLYSGERVALAVGEAGRGRVAALATDLSRSWLGWREVSGFLGGMVRWLAQTPARPHIQALSQPNGVRVVLEGQFEHPWLRHAGLEQAMPPVGPLRYEALLPPGSSGEAVVLEGDQPRLSLRLPELPEWRLEDGRVHLARLAEASGGRLLTSPAELRQLPSRADLSTRPYLLGLAILLFLLERYFERRVGLGH